LRVFSDPAGSEADWNFFASLGVHLQPVIPDP
jgi:hypothetical protein